MDYNKLYEPYQTKEAPLVTDQVKWLQKNGFPQHIIDQSLVKVYDELDRGRKFEADEKHSATWHLWNYLREVARELHKVELEAYLKNLEAFQAKLRENWNEDLRAIARKNESWWRTVYEVLFK